MAQPDYSFIVLKPWLNQIRAVYKPDFPSYHCSHCQTMLGLFFVLLWVLSQLIRLKVLNCLSFSASSWLIGHVHWFINVIDLCTVCL